MKNTPHGARSTYNQLKPLDGIVRPLTRKALKSHNTLLSQILLDWSTIVCDQYSCIFRPLKMRLNPKTQEMTLTLGTSSPQGAFLLRYDHDRIVAEINTFFGGTVIHRLTISHLQKQESSPSPHQTSHGTTLEEALAALSTALKG